MDKETLVTLGVALGLPTLLQLSPIKINPWSWIWKLVKRGWTGFCRSLNAPVLIAMETVKEDILETKKTLDAHIAMDDEREADKVRASILHFNNELMRQIPHTEEEFVEILSKIDWYNDYCREHKNYKNSRAVYAIENIARVYTVRLQKNDFLK